MTATPFRSALAQAALARLQSQVPDLNPMRARRAEVAEHERPLVVVATGDAEADETFSAGETLWTVQLFVTAYLTTAHGTGASGAANADRTAEDNAAEVERRIVAALNSVPLPRPGGGDLTCGVWVQSSTLDVLPAERAAVRLIDLTMVFMVRMLTPASNPVV
jgi:hypothetical protein